MAAPELSSGPVSGFVSSSRHHVGWHKRWWRCHDGETGATDDQERRRHRRAPFQYPSLAGRTETVVSKLKCIYDE